MRSREGSLFWVLAAAALAAGTWGCSPVAKQAPSAGQSASGGYTEAARCQSCHADKHRSFQHVGMGRSFAKVTPAQIAGLQDHTAVNHQASGRLYEVVRRDGKLFQRRSTSAAQGPRSAVMELEATHVMGSGNHARTYFHQTAAGELVELPLTWYAETRGWGMSPGFDHDRPADFQRLADDSCLFCHNAFPAADGKLAEGIDCQRCHGPGARHSELAGSNATAADVRSAIVNPARLSPERRMDVCLQCHLETTSAQLPQMLRRFEREPFSYKPGEPLEAYMLHFDHAPGSGHENKFEIVSQGYRLRKSACFLKSNNALTCSSCHDPHVIPEKKDAAAYYRGRCMQCHSTVAAAGHPQLAGADCRGCHMPRRRAEDAVHVVMTDHLVQRRPSPGNLVAPLREQHEVYRGAITLYNTKASESDRELYLGAALVSAGRDLPRGIALLEKSVGPNAPAKAHSVLGEGYLAAGDPNKAIERFQAALSREPGLAKTHYNLARALEAAGHREQARAAYGNALQAKPLFPEAEFSLGNLLAQSGDTGGAEQHFRKAIASRPVYAEAHNNLGNLYAGLGRFAQARTEFEEALRINPALAEAHASLARVLAEQQQLGEALAHAREAVRLQSDNAEARFNLAQLLQATGAAGPAIAEYEQLVRMRPQMVQARLSLGAALADAGRFPQAITQFRETLRLAPGHAEASRLLEMALAVQREQIR